MNDIVNDFELSVRRSPDAEDIFGNTTDDVIKVTIDNGVVQRIPILGHFVEGTKLIEDFRNQRFIKKIYRFLYQTYKFDRERIEIFFEEYSQASCENGYELMLSVLERIDNINKVDVMTSFLRAKLDGYLSIDNYIRLTSSLQIVPYVDLKRLPDYLKSIGTRHDTYMLLAAGLLYNSEIGADGVGKEDGSHYQLNDNGLLFVKYGLGVDVSRCVKSESPIPTATEADIDEMWAKTMETANKKSVY